MVSSNLEVALEGRRELWDLLSETVTKLRPVRSSVAHGRLQRVDRIDWRLGRWITQIKVGEHLLVQIQGQRLDLSRAEDRVRPAVRKDGTM